MDKKKSFARGLLFAVLSAAMTLLASYIAYILDIPNPVIVLVIFMIVFTAGLGNISGAVSAACIIFYALFFFSDDHNIISFSAENRYKCMVIILSLIAIYLLVALLKSRYDKAYASLVELNRKLKEQNHTLEDESDRDALTGIYNRRGGDRRVATCLSENKDRSFQAVFAAMDIDNFKQINDVYGHAAGDEAIQLLVTKMQEAFGGYSILIRNGGDEFQALLYGDSSEVMEKKVLSFADETFHMNSEGQEFDFHISCGYAFYPSQADNMSDLYHKADIALYDVKMSGKHKALPYTWTSDTRRPEQLTLTVSSLSNNLPVAFMIYRADDTEEILIASETLLTMCGCSSFDEFVAYTGGSFRGFVYPEDVDQVEQSIEAQIQSNKREIDEVDYRIRTRDGRIRRIRDLGRLIHDPGLGDLFYVALYDRDTTNRTRDKHV